MTIKNEKPYYLNNGKVVNLVVKYAGGNIAVKVGQYYDQITETLKPLLKWAEIPAQAVEDSKYTELYNFGISSSEANLLDMQLKPSLI